MKKHFILAVLIVLLCTSSAVGKVIIVGSHGGVITYFRYYHLGNTYDPLQFHRENGQLRDATEVANGYGEGLWEGHGIDAIIISFAHQCGQTIYSLISDGTENVSIGHNFIQQNYSTGDKVILLGFSAGGKYAINLADKLEDSGIPVHLLGMVDPVNGLNISIPRNVELALSFIQRGETWDFQGNPIFFYNKDKTEYHCYVVQGPTIKHKTIAKDPLVIGSVSRSMLEAAGEEQHEVIKAVLGAVEIREEDPSLTTADLETAPAQIEVTIQTETGDVVLI